MGPKNREELYIPEEDVAEGPRADEVCIQEDTVVEFYAEELDDEVCAPEDEPLYGKTNKHSDIHVTTDTSEILEQRGSVYGSYKKGVECRAEILSALNYKYEETNLKPMPDTLLVMFSDLALKLMRAASDPTHLDSWVDLEGYARLIKEAMENELSTGN